MGNTLWLFNIAMENGPFIDDFPIKTTIYRGFSMAMLNNQMVIAFASNCFWQLISDSPAFAGPLKRNHPSTSSWGDKVPVSSMSRSLARRIRSHQQAYCSTALGFKWIQIWDLELWPEQALSIIHIHIDCLQRLTMVQLPVATAQRGRMLWRLCLTLRHPAWKSSRSSLVSSIFWNSKRVSSSLLGQKKSGTVHGTNQSTLSTPSTQSASIRIYPLILSHFLLVQWSP